MEFSSKLTEMIERNRSGAEPQAPAEDPQPAAAPPAEDPAETDAAAPQEHVVLVAGHTFGGSPDFTFDAVVEDADGDE